MWWRKRRSLSSVQHILPSSVFKFNWVPNLTCSSSIRNLIFALEKEPHRFIPSKHVINICSVYRNKTIHMFPKFNNSLELDYLICNSPLTCVSFSVPPNKSINLIQNIIASSVGNTSLKVAGRL